MGIRVLSVSGSSVLLGYLSTLPLIMVHSSDQVIEHNAVVSASPTFSPRSQKSLSDTIFRSSDAVHFHVYSKTLLQASESAFKPLINGSLTEKKFRNEVIDIPDSSAILDIILRVFYNIPVSEHSPSLDVLETAVRRMVIYGLVPSEWITPSKPMFEALYSHTPSNAIRVYALAGLHGLRELAERTSAHLLSYNLADLSDDLAKRMGAKYLRRLMSLHLTRVEEFKRIIFQPPHTHPPTPVCGIVEQRNLSRAWAVAASYLAWDSKPDLPVYKIRSTFSTLNEHLTCSECRRILHHRIKDVVVQWLDLKRTI